MTQPRSRLSGLGGLGDFTASPRMLLIVGLALVIGLLGAGCAVALLRLIALFTNLFFFHHLGAGPASPADHRLGPWVIVVPVIGATIVGLMARYGSERIRGHGIPEAIEAILMRGSRTEPKLVLLKPLSAAISIGSGGPFGAEGPIIMTAGSFGSMIAQMIHLTDTERKTLLVSGAAAGMSATFASPLAAVLLAVELLLFEWKPRSLVPVAAASVAAFVARQTLLGPGPLFPVPPHPAFVSLNIAGACLLAGLAAGLLSAVLTTMVYWSEDAFAKLPIHWMWWPPIGGVVVGLGGWLFHRARRGLPDHQRTPSGPGDRRGAWRHPPGEVGDLGGIARVRHVGRRARAAPHDGRRAGRARGRRLPSRRRGILGPGQHGGGARRDDARPLHRGGVRARADPRPRRAGADAARGRGGACVHGPDPAPLHPHRESEPPGLPPEPRIHGGSAGDPPGARRDGPGRPVAARPRDARRGHPGARQGAPVAATLSAGGRRRRAGGGAEQNRAGETAAGPVGPRVPGGCGAGSRRHDQPEDAAPRRSLPDGGNRIHPPPRRGPRRHDGPGHSDARGSAQGQGRQPRGREPPPAAPGTVEPGHGVLGPRGGAGGVTRYYFKTPVTRTTVVRSSSESVASNCDCTAATSTPPATARSTPSSVSSARQIRRSDGSESRRTSPSASIRSTSWVMFDRTQLRWSARSPRVWGFPAFDNADNTENFAMESWTVSSAFSSRSSSTLAAWISANMAFPERARSEGARTVFDPSFITVYCSLFEESSRPDSIHQASQVANILQRKAKRFGHLDDPLEVAGCRPPGRGVDGIVDHRIHRIPVRSDHGLVPLVVEPALHLFEAIQRGFVGGGEGPEHAVDRSAGGGAHRAEAAGGDAEGVIGQDGGAQAPGDRAAPGHLHRIHVRAVGEVHGHLAATPCTRARTAGTTLSRRSPWGRSRLSSAASLARVHSGGAGPRSSCASASVPMTASRPRARAAGSASLASGASAPSESTAGPRSGQAENASESASRELAEVGPGESTSATSARKRHWDGGSGRAASTA